MKTQISPSGSLHLLSQLEVESLKKATSNDWYTLYRSCSLAVLNTGLHIDDSEQLMAANANFDIDIIRNERGIKLDLNSPPEHAFVDGELIRTIRNHLFSVLRDIVFLNVQIPDGDATAPHLDSTTNFVFSILRNANALITKVDPNVVVCWGGHSINDIEYDYTRAVGEELGLRELNICTGCGTGAMEGPMKGAAIGHAMQCSTSPRFIGLTEPSIIASEPPNPVVNELVIMPDIEKRLEAFVRLGHGIVIFPGGPGTAEELLYILGILMHPENADHPLPVILTGPKESEAYFRSIDQFLLATLGEDARKHYQIVIDDPKTVAQIMKSSMTDIKAYRKAKEDAYSFNWSLHIAEDFQTPFVPTHESMGALDLHLNQAPEQLAANLRKAFSGIVAGNIKSEGIKEIEQHGPFILHGDPALMQKMDVLLSDFVAQQRMKLPGSEYHPCYEIKV